MKFNFLEGFNKISNALDSTNEKFSLGRQRIKRVIDELSEIGFDSVRFYDVAELMPNPEKVLILTTCSGKIPINLVGYQIPFNESTLYKSGNFFNPAVDDFNETYNSEIQLDWIDKFELIDKCWVDIPVYVDNQLLGIVACDWKGLKSDLLEIDLIFLRLICSRISVFLVPDANKLESAIRKINRDIKIFDDTRDLIKSGCEIILNTIDVSIGAIFIFNWTSFELVKVFEIVNQHLHKTIVQCPERYSIGKNLTGSAWRDDELSNIIDIDHLIEKKPGFVNSNYYDRHKSILTKVKSVMFQKIGKREQYFLFRLTNRCVDGGIVSPHLVYRHRKIFEILCSELSGLLDIGISNKRLRNIQELTRAIVENVGLSRDVWDLIKQGMNDEGIKNFAILASHKDSQYFTYEYFEGKAFDSWTNEKKKRLWHDDRFYNSLIRKRKPSLVKINRIAKDYGEEHFLRHLEKKNYQHILTFPINLSNIIGILMIFLPENKSSEVINFNKIQNYFPGKINYFETLTDIIGHCIQAEDSHMTAQSAINIIGHIGHEVSNPSAILGQSAIASIIKCLQINTDENNRVWLLDRKVKVEEEMRQIKATMQVARMISEENKGSLQFHFRDYSLLKVIHNSLSELSGEMAYTDQSGIKRTNNFILSPACEKLNEPIVCDPEMLQRVFTNVFRNAIKYSIPPGHNRSIEINIQANPQQNMQIIHIQNWGIRIPEEDYEKIFRRFYRSELIDSKKSIRGMGLGLYVSRKIITAHQGEIYCLSSFCTFNDPTRKEKTPNEGFLNTFEIRIPKTLKPGIIVRRWEEYDV